MIYYSIYESLFNHAKDDSALMEAFAMFIEEYRKDLEDSSNDIAAREWFTKEYNEMVELIKKNYSNRSDAISAFIGWTFNL